MNTETDREIALRFKREADALWKRVNAAEAERDAMHDCITRIRSLRPKHAEFPGQIVAASNVVHHNDVVDAVEALKVRLAEIRGLHEGAQKGGA